MRTESALTQDSQELYNDQQQEEITTAYEEIKYYEDNDEYDPLESKFKENIHPNHYH
jgi:hypothetical protein